MECNDKGPGFVIKLKSQRVNTNLLWLHLTSAQVAWLLHGVCGSMWRCPLWTEDRENIKQCQTFPKYQRNCVCIKKPVLPLTAAWGHWANCDSARQLKRTVKRASKDFAWSFFSLSVSFFNEPQGVCGILAVYRTAVKMHISCAGLYISLTILEMRDNVLTFSCAALASVFHKATSSWCFCCSSSISLKIYDKKRGRTFTIKPRIRYFTSYTVPHYFMWRTKLPLNRWKLQTDITYSLLRYRKTTIGN